MSMLLVLLLTTTTAAGPATWDDEQRNATELRQRHAELEEIDWRDRADAEKQLIERSVQHLKKYKSGDSFVAIVKILGWTMNAHGAHVRATLREEYRNRAKREMSPERLAREVEKFYKILFKYLDQAEKKEPEDDDVYELRRIRAQAHRNTGDYADAAEIYRELIASQPKHDATEQTYLHLIDALMDHAVAEEPEQPDHSAALDECEAFGERFPRSEWWAYVVGYRATCFRQMGELEQAVATLKDEEDYLRKAHAGEKVMRGGEGVQFTEKQRARFGYLIDRLSLEIGLFEFALGNVDEANKRWQQTVKRFEPEEKEGEDDGSAEKEELPYPQAGYLARAQKMLEFVRLKHGRKAPSLRGTKWLTGEPPEAGERLRVILFVNGPEPATLPVYLERLRREHKKELLPLIIGIGGWANNLSPRLVELGKKNRLGYPIGIDDGESRKVCERYGVDWSDAIFLIDREGRIVWGDFSVNASNAPLVMRIIERWLDRESG